MPRQLAAYSINQNNNTHRPRESKQTLSPLGLAVETKRLVVAASWNHSEATVGRQVGRSVNVRREEQQADAQPHRCRTLLQEPFIRVL